MGIALPGTGRPSESGARLWIGFGDDRSQRLEAWAERTARESGACLSPRGGAHWPGPPTSEKLGLTSVEPPAPIGSAAATFGVGRQAVRYTANLAEHAHEAGRLWHLAPPDLGADFSEPQRLETQLSLASFGGVAALTTHPDRWPHDALVKARRALPPLARTLRAADDHALICALRHGRFAWLLWNPSAKPAELGIPASRLRELGPGPWLAYDFWPNHPPFRIENELPAATVPAGGCRLLGLTPIGDDLVLAGSSLHTGMGTQEVSQLRWNAVSERVRVRLRHPGAHCGDLWIFDPREQKVHRVPVDFVDQTEVELSLEG